MWFNLCVDNFGVKYTGNENLKDLFQALLTETYDIVEDWAGELYYGITHLARLELRGTMGGHCNACLCDKNLTQYNHPPPLKPQYCPYTPNPIVYEKDNQAPTSGNTSPLLDAAGK